MNTGPFTNFRMLGFKVQGDLGPFTCYTSKRGKLVWFIKAPPKEPPTAEQIVQRAKFTTAATAWKSLTSSGRALWLLAADRAHLRITGYNLFTYWSISDDRAAISTIEHQIGFNLPFPA